jgi:pimeloyl-ACP methyl ester carboxylesterase
MCTYGYWEKRDLKDVIDEVAPGPIVLVGASLGAAVALQEAPDDPRVVGVVAAESFSDLRTVARERSPRLLTQAMIRRAFSIAEARGDFRADEVSPVAAARRIRVPVLLIHGALDTDTRPDHSRRILAALGGPKELILVEGAHHNESLRADATWQRIESWVEAVLARNGRGAGHSDDGGD